MNEQRSRHRNGVSIFWKELLLRPLCPTQHVVQCLHFEGTQTIFCKYYCHPFCRSFWDKFHLQKKYQEGFSPQRMDILSREYSSSQSFGQYFPTTH